MHITGIWLCVVKACLGGQCVTHVCMPLPVRRRVLLCLKRYWMTGVRRLALPGQIPSHTEGFSGVGAWTPSSMTKRHSSNIPGQRVSELTLIDFLRASQPNALCCHVTMWPAEQTNQLTAEKHTARASANASNQNLIVSACKQKEDMIKARHKTWNGNI